MVYRKRTKKQPSADDRQDEVAGLSDGTASPSRAAAAHQPVDAHPSMLQPTFRGVTGKRGLTKTGGTVPIDARHPPR